QCHIRSRQNVLPAVRAQTLRRQAAPLITIVVELDHRNWLADEVSVTRYGNVFLEGLPECPELFVFAVRVNRDLVDKCVQNRRIQRSRPLHSIGFLHTSSVSYRLPHRVLASSKKDGGWPRFAPAAKVSKPCIKPVLR